MVIEEQGLSSCRPHKDAFGDGDRTSGAVPLDKISYIDFPELRLDEHESTEMPFRYVRGSDNKPVMPKVTMLLLTKPPSR